MLRHYLIWSFLFYFYVYLRSNSVVKNKGSKNVENLYSNLVGSLKPKNIAIACNTKFIGAFLLFPQTRAMVRLPSLPTLASTAAIGGFIVIGSAHYFKKHIQDGIKRSEYYRESLKVVRENRGMKLNC